MVTETARRKKKWVKIPQSPCFCVRRSKWARCGLCNDVVTSEKEMGSVLCNACAGSIANSTELRKE
jgi:hypothetical protein